MPPVLCVSAGANPKAPPDFTFDQPFLIGRADDCDVSIKNEFVSRNHVRVAFEDGQWRVRDLTSANGIYIGNERVEAAPIGHSLTIRLGIRGPFVSFETKPSTNVDRVAEHYFGGDGPAGEHTMIVRQAFQRVQAKQRWKYGRIIAVMAAAVIGVGAFAVYQYMQARHNKALAEDLFYNIKSLDLNIANVERLVQDSQSQQGIEEIRKHRDRRKAMENSYDRFLATLHVYDRKMTPEQRMVLRIARIFGECELDMPAGFAAEIHNYIQKWRSSGKLANAIRTAKDKGYTVKITDELLARDLPAQFFYLALQESGFDPYASGPMTRKGIAKGMWQFIPETAAKYGLKVGPLVDFRRPDTGDDRDHFDRETTVAARYLKDLYSTDAQASGFLVMACYNWGEDSVLPLVRGMPANPRERNFWRLLSAYRDKIPQQTYDYVFYIASAAVIGEDPRLFGFDFDNPLAHLESK
ncbi:MAG: FHA domain-containing protein [Bryobacteraceae bacterium]